MGTDTNIIDPNVQHLFWKGKDDRWVFYDTAKTYDKAVEKASKVAKRDNCETMIVTEVDEFAVMCRRKDG